MLDDREQAFEQAFVHDEDLRFKINTHRNKLFGRWAVDRLGYTGDVAQRYQQALVDAVCVSDGIMEPDDKVVSRVYFDLTGAGWQISADEVRRVLLEFEDRAKAELKGASVETPAAA